MNILNIHHKIFFICAILTGFTLYSIPEASDDNITKEQKEIPSVSFNYENESLENIVNELATLKNLNVILPQTDPLNTKVTLHQKEKLTLTESWNLLITLLDIAGFTIVPRNNTIRIIKNTGKEISREPMPTYIGTSIDQIPKTDQYIRYLYYLANIKVSDASENELNGILKDLLPDGALFKADPATNGLLIVAKANDIHAIMKIINELDVVGFQEKVDIIPLTHTSAGIVAQLLNEQLLKTEGTNSYRLDTKKSKEVPYFSGFTKVIPEERLNKLILLGKSQAVERLKSFIREYIDVAPDSGESVLHIYQLQYLDATSFAPALQNIVQGSRSGGPSQARGGEKVVGGIERFFDEVIIAVDKPSDSDELKYSGGNKLIVAARNDDWKQIKKIIEELDQPQLQVLLEVLVADLTVDDIKNFGAMTRTPEKIPLPDGIEFQTAQLGLPPLPNQLPNPTSLNADLLRNGYDSDGALTSDAKATANVANFARAGTTMLSLNDNNGKTWSILELQQAFSNSKIISHPHVMATNNKEASVRIGEQRLLRDAPSGSQGGTTIINFKPINALLEVKITPRISTNDTVNLQVLVTINEFVSAPSTSTDGTTGGNNTQNTRTLDTNANIKSGGIFALGGLIKNTTVNTITETPFLSKVPILGWFLKKRSNEVVQNNLTVFICPTIIQPRLRGGVNSYSQDYINLAKNYTNTEQLFSALKDPITHWFFKSPEEPTQTIDGYVNKTQQAIDRYVTEAQLDNPHPGKIVKKKKKATKKKEIITVHNDKPDNKNDLKNIIKNDPNPFARA